MKIILKNLVFLLFLLFTKIICETVTKTMTAIMGPLNIEITEDEDNNKITNFDLKVKLDFNITKDNYEMEVKVKIDFDESNDYKYATCTIDNVKILGGNEFVYSYLHCSIQIDRDDTTGIDILEAECIDNCKEESDGIVVFKDFVKLRTQYTIKSKKIGYTKSTFCQSNNLFFEITCDENLPIDPYFPAQANLFNIELDKPENREAFCMIPCSGNLIRCYIDVEKNKIQKGQIIAITSAKTGNEFIGYAGLSADVDAPTEVNEFTVEEDCGESLSENYIKIKCLFLLSLLFLIF